MLSDATRDAYDETKDLGKAYTKAQGTHNEWVNCWGDENTFAQAHGEFGHSLVGEFGLPRTLMSTTTDLDTAKTYAAGGGRIYDAWIPRSQLIPQTLSNSNESEQLLRLGSDKFSVFLENVK